MIPSSSQAVSESRLHGSPLPEAGRGSSWARAGSPGRVCPSAWLSEFTGVPGLLQVGLELQARHSTDALLIIRRIKWACRMGPSSLKFFYTAVINEARNALEYSLDLLGNTLPQESADSCEKTRGRPS